MSTSIYALATTDVQADVIVKALQSAGFRGNDISVLFPDKNRNRDFAHEKNSGAADGAIIGGVSGGLVGGALGWVAGLSLLTVPGIGPFVAAGPIVALLSGAAIGVAAGGLTGSLIAMGMPEFDAKRYEGKIREGRILILVHADNSSWTNKAEQVLKDAGAEDINSAISATIKDPVAQEASAKITQAAKH